jgi:DNA-binding GntR family transcriptional regulator
VATVTVRQALKLLSNEGLVNSARGRGTFVNEAVPARADDKRLRDAISDPGAEGTGDHFEPQVVPHNNRVTGDQRR